MPGPSPISVPRSGGPTVAPSTLQDGLDLAERCGATVLAERARRELLATGSRPRRQVVLGIGANALTASERRVADLAVRGLSNPEIAQALFVGRKTVETHSATSTTSWPSARATSSRHARVEHLGDLSREVSGCLPEASDAPVRQGHGVPKRLTTLQRGDHQRSPETIDRRRGPGGNGRPGRSGHRIGRWAEARRHAGAGGSDRLCGGAAPGHPLRIRPHRLPRRRAALLQGVAAQEPDGAPADLGGHLRAHLLGLPGAPQHPLLREGPHRRRRRHVQHRPDRDRPQRSPCACTGHAGVERLRRPSGRPGAAGWGRRSVAVRQGNLVGHSLGSGIATVEAATFNDVDGLILTGFLHTFAPAIGAVPAALYPARDDPRFAGRNLPVDYLTTQPGTRGWPVLLRPDGGRRCHRPGRGPQGDGDQRRRQ